MFKIETEPLYWWPIAVRWPAPDKPGEFVEHGFQGRYRWLDDKVHAALVQECIEQKLAVEVAAQRVLVGFRHVQAADGSPLEDTPHNLSLLLGQQGVARAAWDTYVVTRDKAAEKNS